MEFQSTQFLILLAITYYSLFSKPSEMVDILT